MSDQPVVEVAAKNGGEKAFVQAIAYRNGKPRSRTTIWVCVGVTILLTIVSLMKGPPDEKAVVLDEGFLSIPAVATTDKIDLPSYEPIHTLKDEVPKKSSGVHRIKPETVEKLTGPQLLQRPRTVKIPPGTMVKAKLVSGATNGLVKAALEEALVINGERVADSGTEAIGTGSSTDKRLFIRFAQLVFRDSSVAQIQAEALDVSDKTVGLKGSLIGYQAIRLATGIGLNFLAGAAEGLQETRGEQGATLKKPTTRNAILSGTAKASVEQSNEMMQGLRNETPIIEVKPGTSLYIMFNGTGA